MTRMHVVVETRCGKLRGCFCEGVAAFKGIPYAVPPFGVNRLLPPRPVERWDGTREALAFGPKSPQVAYPPGIAEALAELVDAGEDCLTLNVWTPDLGRRGLPVMVWIAGGMFEFHATGATAFYDGGRFARDGPKASYTWPTASRTWVSWTRSPRSNGYSRTSRCSVAIPIRSPSSESRPAL